VTSGSGNGEAHHGAPPDPIKAGPDGVVGVLLAGGQGTRLGALTAHEAKPAVPFVQGRRIVDFVMANAHLSGIDSMLVCTQWHPETLVDHVTTHWAVGFAGGLAFRDGAAFGGYHGTAHAVACNAAELDAAGPREVIVLAADHIYRMNYRDMIAAHRRIGAPVTVGAIPVPRDEARSFGVFETDGPCHARHFFEKPLEPPPMFGSPDNALASMGIYVFNWAWLRSRLCNEGQPPLDFGNDILPGAVDRGEVAVYCFTNHGSTNAPYWRDVGTIAALDAARADFDGADPPFVLPALPAQQVPAPSRWQSDRDIAQA
jgi:glucose-1-phosphate adenylyltransferase